MMRVQVVRSMIMASIVLTGDLSAGLISDGSFESGAAFSTEYLYGTDLTSSGTIVVGYDPCDHHPYAASYGDHTSGRGRMLIANGSTDGDLVIWEQTVSVSPNTEYAFYYWLSTWTPSVIQAAQIRTRFNGVKTGPAGFTSPVAGEWGLVLFRWNSGSLSQVKIQLVDRAGTIENNDFALDDIGMIEAGDTRILMTSSTVGGWVDSPGQGALLYPQGESVVVEARCEPGYEFAGWAGEFSDPSPRIWVQMDADRVATATFRKLDYSVTIQACGAAANEFSPCSDSVDKLSVLCEAVESGEPNGLILGERKGLCDATYLFPIIKLPAGVQELTRVVVNVYGRTLSSGSAVWVADDGPHRPIAGGVHCSFDSDELASMLDDSQEFVYWLPVRINASMGGWDLGSIYVSYECPGVPESLLGRFHDVYSIYRTLECYAASRTIRDLYELRSNDGAAWQAVAQAMAFAEDLSDAEGVLRNVIRREVRDLRESLSCWKSLAGSWDPAALEGCNTRAIIGCLDEAVSGGRLYLLAYTAALADGEISEEEAQEMNQAIASWKEDLTSLDAAMKDSFESLRTIYQNVATEQDGPARVAAETSIRAMAPWLSGRADDSGHWSLSRPTYLEQVIQSLQEHSSQ